MYVKDTDICTLSEAARKLGKCRATLSAWVNKGKLPCRKIGRCVLVRVSEAKRLDLA